jgi:hypothetical protein
MKNFPTFEEFIGEAVEWNQGGIIFIVGKPDSNKQKNLYLARAMRVVTLQRTNLPAEMVNLYPEIYIVKEEDSRLVAKKIMYDNRSLKNSVGLSSLNVVLNKNKTPYWRNTIREIDLGKVLRDSYSLVKNLDVKL